MPNQIHALLPKKNPKNNLESPSPTLCRVFDLNLCRSGACCYSFCEILWISLSYPLFTHNQVSSRGFPLSVKTNSKSEKASWATTHPSPRLPNFGSLPSHRASALPLALLFCSRNLFFLFFLTDKEVALLVHLYVSKSLFMFNFQSDKTFSITPVSKMCVLDWSRYADSIVMPNLVL